MARPLLLVLDIDGTLLAPDGELRPRVRAAVRAAADRGALVTLATGRRLEAATAVVEALGIELPLILHDGAVLQEPGGRLLHHEALPSGLLAELVALAVEHAVHPAAYRVADDIAGDAVCVLDEADGDPDMASYLSRRSPVERGDAAWLGTRRPVVRMQGFGERVPVARFAAAARALDGPHGLDVLEHGRSAFALMPLDAAQVVLREVNKARALRLLARRCGLTLRDCVVVGDGPNDLALLTETRAAGGTAIAMGQAAPALRAAAGHVAPSNADDGVATAIADHVLPRL